MSSLEKFLSTKELFYKDIDYDYFPNLWKKIKHKFEVPKVIHIVGTNGKGSTGRFLAWYLFNAGYKVGHYSSPHILNFNERIWLNGSNVKEETLEKAHQNLIKKLDESDIKKLSYFEYTTILAIEIFQNLQYIVLEAGLGGEFDATNVFKKLFSLITPIAKDHESFLGNNLKSIATTKLKSINKFAIFAKQEEEVYKVADKLKITYYKSLDFFNKEELNKITKFIKENHFASYLKENLILAMSAIKELDIKYDIKYLDGVKLNGRFQKISKNITIDVGHNILAAKEIKNELKDKKIILIYNSYKDKDFKSILELLRENIEKVLILEVQNERMIDKFKLEEALNILKIPYSTFMKNKISLDKDYLVFGSFVVVEEFLKMQF